MIVLNYTELTKSKSLRWTSILSAVATSEKDPTPLQDRNLRSGPTGTEQHTPSNLLYTGSKTYVHFKTIQFNMKLTAKITMQETNKLKVNMTHKLSAAGMMHVCSTKHKRAF